MVNFITFFALFRLLWKSFVFRIYFSMDYIVTVLNFIKYFLKFLLEDNFSYYYDEIFIQWTSFCNLLLRIRLYRPLRIYLGFSLILLSLYSNWRISSWVLRELRWNLLLFLFFVINYDFFWEFWELFLDLFILKV